MMAIVLYASGLVSDILIERKMTYTTVRKIFCCTGNKKAVKKLSDLINIRRGVCLNAKVTSNFETKNKNLFISILDLIDLAFISKGTIVPEIFKVKLVYQIVI